MPKYQSFTIDGRGYEQAQQYYGNLKKQFLEQFQNASKQQGKESFKEASNAIINSLTTNTASKIDGKEVNDVLNDIFAEFASQFTDSNGSLSAFRKIVDKKIKNEDMDNIKKSHEARAKFLQNIQQSIDQQIGSDHFNNILRKTLTRVIEDSSYSVDAVTLHDLINRSRTLLKIAMSIYIQGFETYHLNGITSITLQGYLREQAELNGLKELFKTSPVTVIHGGALKVGGKETEFDNILSFTDEIGKSFNRQVRATADLMITATDLEKQLLPKIQYYGEQVKSFNIRNNKISYFRMIGSREPLLAQLKAESQGYISVKDNLSFLAQAKNIISTFGPATVLFSSGAGRQWMSDFIFEFRKENYLLSFQRKKKEFTPVVGLNRFSYVDVI